MERPMLARLLFALFLAGAAPAFAQDALYLPDLMKNPAYRSAWANMIKGEEVPLGQQIRRHVQRHRLTRGRGARRRRNPYARLDLRAA